MRTLSLGHATWALLIPASCLVALLVATSGHLPLIQAASDDTPSQQEFQQDDQYAPPPARQTGPMDNDWRAPQGHRPPPRQDSWGQSPSGRHQSAQTDGYGPPPRPQQQGSGNTWGGPPQHGPRGGRGPQSQCRGYAGGDDPFSQGRPPQGGPQGHGPPDPEALFDEIDADGNGSISKDEFIRHHEERHPPRGFEQGGRQQRPMQMPPRAERYEERQ